MNLFDFILILISILAIIILAATGLMLTVLNRGEILHFPHIPKRKVKQKTGKTADEMMKEAIQELRSVPGGREWAEEQARIAGFEIPARNVSVSKVVPMTGGNPVLFPTDTGLLEINGTWYEKWINDKGSYLKEVAAPRAQEKVHEESTTVRDLAGSAIAEHQLCECVNCSAWRWVPDGICDSGIPSGLDAGLQHP